MNSLLVGGDADGVDAQRRISTARRTAPPRIIVCGSRGWTDRQKIANRLFDVDPNSTIVTGAARGADRIAAQEAQKLGLLIEEHPADWKHYGKRAGVIRNAHMASLGADLCIAFWDGRSNGTKNMIECCMRAGITYELVS